jgi:hypothetical protein
MIVLMCVVYQDKCQTSNYLESHYLSRKTKNKIAQLFSKTNCFDLKHINKIHVHW